LNIAVEHEAAENMQDLVAEKKAFGYWGKK
jgi:hypothetical protein